MTHYSIDDLKNIFPSKNDQELINALSKGVLKLSQSEIDTIQFVFFLSRIAEQDIELVLTHPWKILATGATTTQIRVAKDRLNERMTGNKFTQPPLEDVLKGFPQEHVDKILASVKDRYRNKSSLDIDNLETFGDKILAYEAIKSKNNVSGILWKLKKLRDCISHGRITGLTYEKLPLVDRLIKEKLFFDYMIAVNNPESDKSGLEEVLKTTWTLEENEALDELSRNILIQL